jgi:flagellar biosynthetic protein FliQ
MDAFDSLVREGLLVCAMLCFPVLVAATLVGTLIAILQAATSVQEQTLTLLPKLIAVAVVIVLWGPAGFTICAQLFTDAIAHGPELVLGPR